MHRQGSLGIEHNSLTAHLNRLFMKKELRKWQRGRLSSFRRRVSRSCIASSGFRHEYQAHIMLLQTFEPYLQPITFRFLGSNTLAARRSAVPWA